MLHLLLAAEGERLLAPPTRARDAVARLHRGRHTCCVQRCPGSALDWNTVAVARRGMTGRAIEALAGLGRFRNTRYPQVLVGSIPEPAADQVAAYGRVAELAACLERLLPLERSLPFERADVTETLCAALESEAERVAGASFYVRARLRGLEGLLEARAVERAIGGFLVERTSGLGRPATVRFDDPDFVLMIEVVERRVGYGFLDRRVRSVPLVRPR